MEIVRVENVALPGNKIYSGQGYYKDSEFVPQGFGWIRIQEAKAYGHFINGVMNGPAYHPMDYMMYTMQMANDRGNGWGMMINGGVLFFGYYENSDMKVEMTDAVQWYFDLMTGMGKHEAMFHGYYNAGEIMIGWKGTDTTDFMGFHYMVDGSVYVGSSKSLKKTGFFMKFCPDGTIQIGEFQEGSLIKAMDIQELIGHYYDDEFLFLQATINKGSFNPVKKRDYKDVRIDTSVNYFKLKENPDLKKPITQNRKAQDLLAFLEKESPILKRRLHSLSFPIDGRDISVKRVNLQGSMMFWGMVDSYDSPLGYGIIEDETEGSLSLVFLAEDGDILNFEDEGEFLFGHCSRVQSTTFYKESVYVGDIVSQASWHGSSHYSTSRFGLAVLKDGMYVGEFPAGFCMKKVIGRHYDLDGKVWSGIFNLPINEKPEWTDNDGGIFPF